MHLAILPQQTTAVRSMYCFPYHHSEALEIMPNLRNAPTAMHDCGTFTQGTIMSASASNGLHHARQHTKMSLHSPGRELRSVLAMTSWGAARMRVSTALTTGDMSMRKWEPSASRTGSRMWRDRVSAPKGKDSLTVNF